MAKTDLDKINDRAFDSFNRIKQEQISKCVDLGMKAANHRKENINTSTDVYTYEPPKELNEPLKEAHEILDVLKYIETLNKSNNIKCVIGILIGATSIQDIQTAKSYLEKELEESATT